MLFHVSSDCTLPDSQEMLYMAPPLHRDMVILVLFLLYKAKRRGDSA